MKKLLKDMKKSKRYNWRRVSNIKQSDVRHARDNIRAALTPHLGPNLALERANNIAQALVMGSEDIRGIILDMLRNTGAEDIETMVTQVVHAWDSTIRPPQPGY